MKLVDPDHGSLEAAGIQYIPSTPEPGHPTVSRWTHRTNSMFLYQMVSVNSMGILMNYVPESFEFTIEFTEK